MPNLPAFTAPVHEPSAAWAAIRERVAEGRRIDPQDGCFEEPWLEIGTAAGLAAFGAAVLLGIAAVVTVFFTRGPLFLGLLGAAVAAGVLTKVLSAKEVARIRRMRRESRVVPGAWAYVENHLSSPGERAGVGIFVIDPREAPDPAAVAETAGWLGDALRAHTDGKNDPALPPGFDRLSGQWTRVPLDPAWSRHEGLWMVRLNVEPKLLPRGCVDRTLWPLLAHPADTEDAVSPLPPAFWWREDVEALLQP